LEVSNDSAVTLLVVSDSTGADPKADATRAGKHAWK
jgi:hypothetical protein